MNKIHCDECHLFRPSKDFTLPLRVGHVICKRCAEKIKSEKMGMY